jgi:CspA family cold shock protein
MTTRARSPETAADTAPPAAKKAKTEDKTEEKLLSGTVTTFHATRGFGFVTPDEAGKPDVFVHQSSIYAADDGYRYLRVGQKVGYTAEFDDKKGKWKALKCCAPSGAPLPTRPDPKKQAAEKKTKKGKGGAVPAMTAEELLAAVQKQIEYYLSDKNLTRDQWMREQILANGNGAVSVESLLKCNKLKALTTDEKVLESAVSASALLHWTSVGEAKQAAIGRGADADNVPPLPEYSPPVIALLQNLAAEKIWKDVRTAYLNAYNAPINVYLSATTPFIVVNAENKDTVAQAAAEGLKDIDGKDLCGVVAATAEQQETLLKFHYDSLATASAAKKARSKTKGKKGGHRSNAPTGPVWVGDEKFENTQAVFDKIRGIMRETKASQPLLGAERKFMLSVFNSHPRAAEKLQYMRQVIIKDNENFDEASQCFFIVKRDNVEEDISYVKCVNNLPTTAPASAE